MKEKKNFGKKDVKTRRVSITILEKDYKQIHRLVAQNKYLSFSEFIREAIRIQLNENIKNEEFKKISVSLHNIDVALQ
ncbi:MAG: ribbon-helix-helix domain-containing protein [archaeon]|nr:ribbon-helix-helix domain-containing protein [archaeon]